MKLWNSSILGLLLVIMAVMLYWQGQLRAKLRQENQTLRLRIEQLEASNAELSRAVTATTKGATVSEEQLRELLKLRGEVTILRRRQDELLNQLAVKPTVPPAQPAAIDKAWVEQVLGSPPKSQGMAAGNLRGKLLRREMTNVSPAELALKDELLKRHLNQTLERSPAEFADFQTGFIQSTLNISDETRMQQVHDLIQSTYEQAVANGLDVPSKPVNGTDQWVERRFALDRAATARLKELFTPDERMLFDRAFLGVMGVDLGGVGVDKSNYPKGFLGEP